jgi:drug/metabolite transporter (DMT)-like permease
MTTTDPLAPPTTPAAAAPTRQVLGAGAGAFGMVFVGGSVAVSAVLRDGPLFWGQGIRYAAASALLVGVATALRVPLVRPRGREWLWLLGVSMLGLVVFNVALVVGSAHAEPAVLGVAVASVPIVMAALGPLLQGETPRRRILAAAGVVTVGAALVQGFGRSDAVGLAWAVVVLACEAGFTLFAVPLLGRQGPWGISVHSTWIGAAVFLGLALTVEGPAAVGRLEGRHLASLGYLAVMVTAVAFVLWYSAVRSLGPGRAGLLTGVAPVSAVVVGVLLGGPFPGPVVWCGVAAVALGLAVGLDPRGRGVAPRRTA